MNKSLIFLIATFFAYSLDSSASSQGLAKQQDKIEATKKSNSSDAETKKHSKKAQPKNLNKADQKKSNEELNAGKKESEKEATNSKQQKEGQVKLANAELSKAKANQDEKSIPLAKEKSDDEKRISYKGRRTEGSYLGLSANLNKLSYHEEYTDDQTPYKAKTKPSSYNSGVGLGLSYKYAVNFNKFFIAPGVFLEKDWSSARGTGKLENDNGLYPDVARLDIKNRYGLTADFGYDFNDVVAGYVMAGYSIISYRAKNGFIVGDAYQTNLRESSKGSAIFGIGTKFNYSDHVSFNVEANTQKFNFKTNADVALNQYLYDARYTGRFNTLKVGISYRF